MTMLPRQPPEPTVWPLLVLAVVGWGMFLLATLWAPPAHWEALIVAWFQ